MATSRLGRLSTPRRRRSGRLPARRGHPPSRHTPRQESPAAIRRRAMRRGAHPRTTRADRQQRGVNHCLLAECKWWHALPMVVGFRALGRPVTSGVVRARVGRPEDLVASNRLSVRRPPKPPLRVVGGNDHIRRPARIWACRPRISCTAGQRSRGLAGVRATPYTVRSTLSGSVI